MRRVFGLSVVSLVLVCHVSSAAAGNPFKAGWKAHKESTMKNYPLAPEVLESDPGASGLLLVEGIIEAGRSSCDMDRAAIVGGDDAELIRAGQLRGKSAERLVLFHDLQPGTYSLALMLGYDHRGSCYAEVPPTPTLTVEIEPGQAVYLGRVVWESGGRRKPTTIEVQYEPEREVRAWYKFRKVYSESPWGAIAHERIAVLQSPPAEPESAPVVVAEGPGEPGVAPGEPAVVAIKPVVAAEEPGAESLGDLLAAVQSGDHDQVKSLLASGADVNGADEDGDSPLHLAASRGQDGIAKLLVDGGADVAARNGHGFTPLHMAAGMGDRETTTLLIEHGADVTATTESGDTPLHFAAEMRNFEMAQITRALGASSDGYVWKEDNVAVAKILIEKGADVDARNGLGRTPLQRTTPWNNLPVAKLLVESGADTELADNGGKTPLDHARKKKAKDVKKLLTKLQASR